MNDKSRHMPITELDLPLNTYETEEPLLGAKVLVDGHPARCFLSAPAWRSDGIVIKFDPPHPRFGKEFGTKHYHFPAPGLLGWGHSGEVMEIVLVLDDAKRAH